jgi:hypothetical protein
MLIIGEFRENRSKEGRTFLLVVNEISLHLYRGLVLRHFESKKKKNRAFGVLYCIMKHAVRKLFIDTLSSSIVKFFSIVVLGTELINFE